VIRKADATNNEALMPFVSREPSFNIFIIADIEQFGYGQDFQEIWIDCPNPEIRPDRKNRLDQEIRAVLLRYRSSYVIYAPTEHDIDGFARILSSSTQLKVFSGKPETLLPYVKRLLFSHQRNLYFARIDPKGFCPIILKDVCIQRATPKDAEDLNRLRSRVAEFADLPRSTDAIRKRLKSGLGRTYLIRERDEIVSSVSTSAETSVSAMIGGVMTHPNYRGRGYASFCLSVMCDDLNREGKIACLTYDNPAADRIYKRVGFKDVGRWMICIK
jgi:predicted GNAT family acetyltransferase